MYIFLMVLNVICMIINIVFKNWEGLAFNFFVSGLFFVQIKLDAIEDKLNSLDNHGKTK